MQRRTFLQWLACLLPAIPFWKHCPGPHPWPLPKIHHELADPKHAMLLDVMKPDPKLCALFQKWVPRMEASMRAMLERAHDPARPEPEVPDGQGQP